MSLLGQPPGANNNFDVLYKPAVIQHVMIDVPLSTSPFGLRFASIVLRWTLVDFGLAIALCIRTHNLGFLTYAVGEDHVTSEAMPFCHRAFTGARLTKKSQTARVDSSWHDIVSLPPWTG